MCVLAWTRWYWWFVCRYCWSHRKSEELCEPCETKERGGAAIYQPIAESRQATVSQISEITLYSMAILRNLPKLTSAKISINRLFVQISLYRSTSLHGPMDPSFLGKVHRLYVTDRCRTCGALYRDRKCSILMAYHRNRVITANSLAGFECKCSTLNLLKIKDIWHLPSEVLTRLDGESWKDVSFRTLVRLCEQEGGCGYLGDREQTNAALFKLEFFLRLFHYPGDRTTPAKLLRGFITVPFQFGPAALELANASGYPFPLPSRMEAPASTAQ